MSGGKSVRARAYTSIANLGHGFDSFGLCVDVASDDVEARLATGAGREHPPVQLRVSGPHAGRIPSDADRNTAGRAVLAMLASSGVDEPVRIHVIKGIPAGSGLGSSAASAAAAVTAVNALLGLGHAREALIEFAAAGESASAGAAHLDNVAASMMGGFTIAMHDGTLRLLHLEPIRQLRIVVARPRVELTTRTSRSVLPQTVAFADYTAGCARAGLVAGAVAAGDVDLLGVAIEGSVVDRCRIELIRGFAGGYQAAHEAGAAGVAVSGGGPSMAAVVGSGSDPRRIARAVQEAFASASVECDVHVCAPAGGAEIVGT